MKNGIPETQEEFVAQLRKTQEDIFRLRQKTWERNERAIQETLDNCDIDLTDSAKEAYLILLKGAWMKGYNDGAADMSKYMAREMGGGEIVDAMESMQKLTEQIRRTSPEKN